MYMVPSPFDVIRYICFGIKYAEKMENIIFM